MNRITTPRARRDEPGIPALLARLIEELARVRDGRGASAGVERWEDDAFVYLEAGLPAMTGPMMDICLSGGRAYIRMEQSAIRGFRSPAEPEEIAC